MTPVTFTVFKNEEKLFSQTFTQSVIKIGKLGSSHLKIEDDDVSRMHAVIEVDGDHVNIIDLGSVKGTRVNGQKVNKCRLTNGDDIHLGESIRVLFEWRDENPEEKVKAEAARAAEAAKLDELKRRRLEEEEQRLLEVLDVAEAAFESLVLTEESAKFAPTSGLVHLTVVTTQQLENAAKMHEGMAVLLEHLPNEKKFVDRFESFSSRVLEQNRIVTAELDARIPPRAVRREPLDKKKG